MREKPIKVDAETDRTVSELAFFLRTTKKAVVRTAVAEYAEKRTAYLGDRPPSESDRTLLALPPLERLGLRRTELIREFARRRATAIRLLDESVNDRHDVAVILLAQTDPADGSAAHLPLQQIASALLATPVEVISTTMLELFDPPAHRRALELSRPL
ncbi:hypothetical protein BCL57_001456 [Agromyces flavus]|uniref:Uncharacterized protein n=1 Tax=Agromyces flavus TaxID=589382 RepID=A0A1H1ZXD3_9MICO|nr:hypothetical protein [Agromyces flavus]MCP2367302.1 hypothetical protein [Agromyces flavus]GGI45998.1 hypothetical protein GCM10010932_12390 [Agromyces flavus]SDT37906.1 hypothetical protein SAMN04489721_3380 [Agromyces flavus]